MSVFRQGSMSHKSDEDMSGGEKLCRVFIRPVCDTFDLKPVGFQGVRDQAVVGAAVKCIITVVRSPLRDICWINCSAAKAVDDHRDSCRTAAVFSSWCERKSDLLTYWEEAEEISL